MKSNFIKKFFCFAFLLILAACSSTGNSSSNSSSPNIDPNSANKDGSKVIKENYTARNGAVIEVEYRYDGLLRGYGMGVRRVDGTNFDKSEASYQLVQSLTREYFYAKVCSNGFHPGVIYNFYRAVSESGDLWSVKLKCFARAQQASDNPKI